LALFVAPIRGALAVTLWVGIYALAFGILTIVLAVRMRRQSAFPARAPALSRA